VPKAANRYQIDSVDGRAMDPRVEQQADFRILSLESELAPLWERTFGDPGNSVAVLDGPVDLIHPCFLGANIEVVPSLALTHRQDGMASLHGTHIASILFGQHGGLVKGVCPNCRGFVVAVFSEGQDGSVTACSQPDLARAITQAVTAGANVINISGGELEPSGQTEPHVTNAIEPCHCNNILVVAAAGSDGCVKRG